MGGAAVRSGCLHNDYSGLQSDRGDGVLTLLRERSGRGVRPYIIAAVAMNPL
jgi:hypothetical protein